MSAGRSSIGYRLGALEIGRAAWRGRGEISVGAGLFKKKKKNLVYRPCIEHINADALKTYLLLDAGISGQNSDEVRLHCMWSALLLAFCCDSMTDSVIL